ncbi:MAG: dihydrolipoyl dehydrogenase [Thermoplasmata archaeon]|nr:dihydrolipoyl dehydrogenase [Thermoplasmata archaeon]
MKEYDVIAIGTGSAVSVVDGLQREDPHLRAAIVDKDEPGGICLTRGCIPSKLLLYPAEVVRTVERASEFGITAPLKSVDFGRVMDRMRRLIGKDIEVIRQGLSHSTNIDYYPASAEFVAPYTLKVGEETLHAPKIVLGLGSEVLVPRVPGLEEAGYLTSDTVLRLEKRPASLVVIGGGYIAAEYGHFFASMGCEVTILGRNARFLPDEDPEVAQVAQQGLSRHLTIRTSHEVVEVRAGRRGRKDVVALDRISQQRTTFSVDEILVACGRGPTSGRLHAEKAGIALDPAGWVVVNDYLETSQPGIYALGDATGRFPFKHKANYDAKIVFRNLAHGQKEKADYHAVPHAVFTDPEVAGVGLTEPEARSALPPERLLIGRYRFADTAKGEAMALQGTPYLVKALVDREGYRLVGAHIVGPQASVLVQEAVNLMYTETQSARPIVEGMHIHPALSEVVERAFLALAPASGHSHGTTS